MTTATARTARSSSSRRLSLAAPIERWDEAIPLGNGLMGTLLWGAGNFIKLSLDRGDLWDHRPTERFLQPDWTWATLKRLVSEKDVKRIHAMYDDPYNHPWPTKIPGGRLELTLDRGVTIDAFSLDMNSAVGEATWKGGSLRLINSAAERVGVGFVRGSGVKLKVAPPAFGGAKIDPKANAVNTGDLATLGYPPPETGKAGELQWAVQHAADGFVFAIVAGVRKAKGGTLIAYAVTCTHDGADPLAIGQARVKAALDAGFEKMLRPHVAWWRGFWSQSDASVPDPAIQQQYNLVRYFYGSASRRGAPPIPLQGVWTADEGKLPPWKGDYHHDLNTQLTYWAYLTPGHFDEGLCFLDMLWDLLPRGRRFAKEFYNAPGACLPGVAALDGQPLGGWAQYTVVPTNSAWLAHSFYMHWRYTLDRTFLAERAYPWTAEIGTCIEALLEPGADGKLRLGLSASPEVYDNSLRAWMKPNTNYDIALLQWLYAALAEMATELGDAASATRWKGIADRIEPLHIKSEWPWPGVLMLSADEVLPETHRHHSNLLAVHPLGTLTIEGTDNDRETIARSLGQIDTYGPGYWCGYSFSWMACIAARAGQPEKARLMLELFVKAFISRNGFHLNGDYKNQGLSAFKYRPFTLEGNFAAAQGVHEMLLQTWGGVVRIFPAVSAEWRDASFKNWRGEGALTISADRREGKTRWVSVTSERGGEVRLRDPFAGTKPTWSRRGVKRVGTDYVVQLKAGETVEGSAV